MMRKRRTGARLSGVLGLATLLAVAASGPALAQTGARKAAQKKQAVSHTTGGQQNSAGQAIGQSTEPTPEQARQMKLELSAMLQRSVEDLTVVTLPDGTMMVDLDGGFQNVTMATFDADGQLVVTCVDDLAAAEGLLQSTNVSRLKTRGHMKETGKKTASKRVPVVLEEK